jgi:multiple sugar transport system substrate-binding protein
MAHLTRRTFLKAAIVGGAVLRPPAVLGEAKPFAGVTIKGSSFQHVFHTYLKEMIPEFEAKTGMTVDFAPQAFPIYNQRADLELSTQGSAWDFLNITFIYSGRWIGAGWFAPLDEFVNDRNQTPREWDAADFVSGAQSSLLDAKGTTYGFAWEAGAMLMGAGRADLIDKAGLKLHHWNWIPYLMGYGGRVFKDPPGNLTPTLDTPEAARAADYYASLLVKYGPSGLLSYTDDQAMRAQLSGRANMRTQALGWLSPLAKHEDSRVKSTVRYALMPGGPAGQFPGSNSHGFGIPVGAKNKRAAWAFITWAMSKETLRRITVEKGYTTVCRRSIIDDPAYRRAMTFNGQDVAELYLKVLNLGGKSGYMKYRTVPVFPQVGDKINKAIERIATKQQSARDAMKQAQAEAIEDLKKAGVKLDA